MIFSRLFKTYLYFLEKGILIELVLKKISPLCHIIR